MPNPTKPFWQSKTVWLNVIAAAVAIFADYDNPAQIAQALALVNVVLRFFSASGISLSPR
jgi:hypothetical protein|tara:strand:+ start:1098 stop:1277 length:180 start_codon:yes stop_codon:yes gene_type:complete